MLRTPFVRPPDVYHSGIDQKATEPPRRGDPVFDDVVFLGHFDVAGMPDVCGRAVVSNNLTLQTPGLFGSAGLGSGGNSGVTYTPGDHLNFASNLFTIEATIHLLGTANCTIVGQHRRFIDHNWGLEVEGNKMRWRVTNTTYLTSTADVLIGTTERWAVCKYESGTWGLFRNGVLDAAGTPIPVTSGASSGDLGVGGTSNLNTYGINGWIDEVRLTNGTARYNAAGYALPTEAFPDS